MGFLCAVSHADDRERSTTRPSFTRIIQCLALVRTRGLSLANLPPWSAVYQQTRRWIKAGCFEAMAHDLRAILRWCRTGKPIRVRLLSIVEHSSRRRRVARGLELMDTKNAKARRCV